MIRIIFFILSSLCSFVMPSQDVSSSNVEKMLVAIQNHQDDVARDILATYTAQQIPIVEAEKSDINLFVSKACEFNNLSVLKMLLEARDSKGYRIIFVGRGWSFANINMTDLIWAIQTKNYDIVRCVLMHSDKSMFDWLLLQIYHQFARDNDLRFKYMFVAYHGAYNSTGRSHIQKGLIEAYKSFCEGNAQPLQNLIFHAPKSFQKAYGNTVMIDNVDLALREVFPNNVDRTCMLLFLADTKWQKNMALDYIKSGDQGLETVKQMNFDLMLESYMHIKKSRLQEVKRIAIEKRNVCYDVLKSVRRTSGKRPRHEDSGNPVKVDFDEDYSLVANLDQRFYDSRAVRSFEYYWNGERIVEPFDSFWNYEDDAK